MFYYTLLKLSTRVKRASLLRGA